MGNEYLFQTLAEQNVETLNGLGVTKIVANCPHCFNTLRNEYPDYGGTYEVIHHTQLLARLIAEGRLKPSNRGGRVAHLSRPVLPGPAQRGLRRAPRRARRRSRAFARWRCTRHKERAFCCGAGGARMWMEERLGKRINVERTDEALSTGAASLGVACPYCMIMLDDGVKSRGEELRVLDVAQVVAASIAGPRPRRRAKPAPDADDSQA